VYISQAGYAIIVGFVRVICFLFRLSADSILSLKLRGTDHVGVIVRRADGVYLLEASFTGMKVSKR
jgi:alkyl hydroperoxide reductase subunit AhpF